MAQENDQSAEDASKRNAKWGCLAIVAVALIFVVTCNVCLLQGDDAQEDSMTAMDDWEIAKCGSKSYVFGLNRLSYGAPDIWNSTDARFGWSSELTAVPSSFPKVYYYPVSRKNAFGTETITEVQTIWDYECNLVSENTRIAGFD